LTAPLQYRFDLRLFPFKNGFYPSVNFVFYPTAQGKLTCRTLGFQSVKNALHPTADHGVRSGFALHNRSFETFEKYSL
jgi:hypothetical protein